MQWEQFRIIDLFKIKTCKDVVKSKLNFTKKEYPYVTAKTGNNSVMAYVSYDKSYLNEGNCIFIGGKTLVISYQKGDFFSNDDHNLLLYLREDVNEQVFEFLIAVLYKALKPKYTWNNSISLRKIKSDFIKLPILCDDTNKPLIDFRTQYHEKGYIPDWKYMELYIKEIEQEYFKRLENFLINSGRLSL